MSTHQWGDETERVCCICGEVFIGMGNNPEPLGGEDPAARCCDPCNDTEVIPARIGFIIRENRKK